MKRTVKLNELAKELNNGETKFISYIDFSQEATDRSGKIQGLLVVKAETAVGCYWYNAFFNFDPECEDVEEAFELDEKQDFIDGLWGLEDDDLNKIDVIDEDGEPVDRFEFPESFPRAARKPDFEKLKNDLEAR
ncbi:hypothetical protein [uncultured Parasutterella sp.]|uniref:hypothetical protein n=1 Tax=uncultured Parasutterella sp. TaxID=1263098 RepID=UPI00272C013E|nr:hypothetical protein [uncultured Parasutterella sp.]